MNNSQNLYSDLEKFIKPRLLDDFCGYDEETQSFNIVLAVKQIIEAKEQECQELHNKYDQALDEIGKLIPKFDSSMGCDYGDFDCENCSDLDEDTVCAYKLKKVIKGIINKAKGSE